jgi:anti-anti-sigma factor
MQTRNWDLTFIRIESPLNAETSPDVKAYLSPLLARSGPVVVDLRGATLDSTGLGALLGVQHSLELKGRRLILVADDPHFLNLVERTGVGASLALFPDAEQAVRSVHADGATARN